MIESNGAYQIDITSMKHNEFIHVVSRRLTKTAKAPGMYSLGAAQILSIL